MVALSPNGRMGRLRGGGDQAAALTHRAIGVPEGFRGAVCFSSSEDYKLVLAMVSGIVFDCGVRGDLYVIPEDRSCILMTDHDGAMVATLPGAACMAEFCAAMTAKGFPDPDTIIEREEAGGVEDGGAAVDPPA